jgi:hypothetical protein
MCLEVASDVNPLEKHLSETEKLLNKYELKLNESSKVPTDFVPLNEISLADEAWHNKMTEGEYIHEGIETVVSMPRDIRDRRIG